MRKEETMQELDIYTLARPLIDINIFMEHPKEGYSKQMLNQLTIISEALTFPVAITPAFNIIMNGVFVDKPNTVQLAAYEHREDDIIHDFEPLRLNIYLFDKEVGPVWNYLQRLSIKFRTFSLINNNANTIAIRNYITRHYDK